MDIKRRHRFEHGGVVADWECPICHRVLYLETNIRDLPPDERHECRRCHRALDLAHEAAGKLWDAEILRRKVKFGPGTQAFYKSRVHGSDGFYGIRADLADRLIRGETSKELKRLSDGLGVELPSI